MKHCLQSVQAGILMQKRRKREATSLLNEAKKLDKHGMMTQQIKLMQVTSFMYL